MLVSLAAVFPETAIFRRETDFARSRERGEWD
jgi:hypothetical protein